MKIWNSLSLAVIATASLSNGAAAQSINPSLDTFQNETRVMAAVTIPLGHSRDDSLTAPRFELITRTRAPSSVLAVVARDEDRRWQERRIGFTLDGSDQFMINGRPLPVNDQRDGISTLGAVGIGVGVLLVVSAIVLVDELGNQSD